MAFPRPSCLRGALGRSTLRRAGAQSRSNTFRQGGRRTYASGHEAKKSSDLPWAIGSAVVTIPAATWLLGQAPAKSDHGHHEAEPKVANEGGDEGGEEQPKEEEGDEGSKEESKDKDKDKDKGEDKDEGKSDDSGSEDEGKDTPPTSDDEDSDKPSDGSPGQINKIGQSKGQKARNPTEKKGEKDSAKDYSGAQHPSLDDPGKSKKAEGVTDTAKIHGTVDPRRNSSKPKDD